MSFEGRDGPPLLAGGEADYRTLIERLPIVTYVCEYHPDGRARLRYVSPFVEQLFGYPAESWLGDSPLFVERLHDDDRERVGAAMRRRFREGERFDSEYRLLARDGRVVWVSDRDALVQTAADGSVWSVGNLIDVTALKEAERAVESGERLGREVIEALEEGVAVVGRDGNVVAANRKASEILGIDHAETTGVGAGRPMAPAFFEDGTPVTAENSPTREVLAGGPGRRDVLIRFEREDGPLWVSANYTPLIEPGATTPHGVVWAISDVTARKRAERRQAAVVELGQRALEGGQLDELMDRAMEVVTETLELPLCAL
ncbi:MAG: hypothetical protein QOE08_539, partial [Thermoleophilaceae bacterium]|nr:hypothetical protein [Thermoleophilaceae bacterium]